LGEQLDPTRFAVTTLRGLSDALRDLLAKSEPAPQPDAAPVRAPATPVRTSAAPNWVRNFILQHSVEALDASNRQSPAWLAASKFVILHELGEAPLAASLAEILKQRAAAVEALTFAAAGQERVAESVTGCIAILPRTGERLADSVRRLHAVASVRAKMIVFVQHGDDSVAAFAASLHLERPELKVRALDFDPAVAAGALAERVVAELATDPPYEAAGYDAQLTRRVLRPQVHHLAFDPPRNIAWSKDDVILVTGGAKGITAECAVALAQATGVRMALVGSSPLPSDPANEIARTLDRFAKGGLTCRYYQCNIADDQAVTALVARVAAELGPVTGVIHGAGLNKPRRIEQVTPQAALDEVAPKVAGVWNLCRALEAAPLKLFVGLSSIIGTTGMPGNAWYGFANETLDRALARFGAAHPQTAVLAIAFSVWDEVGMGARMGSTARLAQMGIGAIPVAEGVKRFLQLVHNDPGTPHVIVTTRLAGLDTW
ncbi:MAG: SDR family NAD(P)-dependent oxidoreductase, partial [Verrucomicrobia bacterium]|nr:SDR family NAD(P)-dependent oxidoreductase [Verrucomicrobiota bacterium]